MTPTTSISRVDLLLTFSKTFLKYARNKAYNNCQFIKSLFRWKNRNIRDVTHMFRFFVIFDINQNWINRADKWLSASALNMDFADWIEMSLFRTKNSWQLGQSTIKYTSLTTHCTHWRIIDKHFNLMFFLNFLFLF